MWRWVLYGVLLAAAGCASVDNNAQNPADPWESYNRSVFRINDGADVYVLAPTARGYKRVTPDSVERGVSNVFDNFFEVTTIVNDLMQAKWSQAASDTGRLLVNTTVGLLGVFDVASGWGLKQHNEDFGQTMGYWGIDAGPYVVVPLLGSYTVRDGVGAIIQTQGTGIINRIDHVRTRNQLLILSAIDTRASLLKAENLISGDRYTFIRDAYLQRREFLVNDGQVEDDFGEDAFNSEGSIEDW